MLSVKQFQENIYCTTRFRADRGRCSCILYIHIYIYIVVVQVIRPPTVKPQRELDSYKNILYFLGNRVGARTCCCASPLCRRQILLPLMVLTTFSFFATFKKSYKFSKNVKSYWFIHFNNFFTSRNPPKSTTTKI